MADRLYRMSFEPVLRRAFFALVAAPAFFACTDVTAPRVPDGAVRIEPLQVYALWWEQTRECAGRGGDFGDVTWYEMPGAASIPTDIGPVQGMWLPGNAIVIAGQSLRNGPLVRHEMLHALLQTTRHPRVDFVRRCEGVVVCQSSCRDEEPPPAPDAGAVAIQPSDLEVSVTVSPELAGRDVREGHIQVIVSARNPFHSPVEVQLTASPDGRQPVTWRYSIWRGTAWWNHDERATTPEAARFAPGASKRMIYDLWVGGTPWQEPFDAGTYDVYGAFNSNRTPTPRTMTIHETPVCCVVRHRVR